MKPSLLSFVYFGVDDVSVWVLEELLEAGYKPALVVTTPPKPAGRNLALTPSPLSDFAKESDIEVVEAETLTQESIPEIWNSEWDMFIVASYGKIIPKALLDIPKHGALNVHPSLLPRLRGASPIISAILTDEKETGVTIMLMDEKMDHGPILAQARVEIENWPPQERILRELLSHVGGQLLAETIPSWIKGEIEPEVQDESKATYTQKFKKEDGLIDLSKDPYKEFLKIQALSDTVGTYFFTQRKGKNVRVKITNASLEDRLLKIEKVIPEGKKEMKYEDFLRG